MLCSTQKKKQAPWGLFFIVAVLINPMLECASDRGRP